MRLGRYYPYRSKRELDALRRLAARTVSVAKQRGDLVPQPCEQCGKRRTEAHHDDYAQPLAVRWFCRYHHRRRDAELREARLAAAREAERQTLPVAVLRRIEYQTKRKGFVVTPTAEGIVRDATLAIAEAMERDGVSENRLARILGTSRQHVNVQFAGGFRTLWLFAKYADALGYDASVVLRKRVNDEAVAS